MWPLLYLPKGRFLHEKLDYWSTDLSAFFKELQTMIFSGYLEIVSPNQRGLFVFHQGRVYGSFYEGSEDLDLKREEIFRHFLQKKKREHETIIQVTFVEPRVVEALGALDTKSSLYRELETSFLDMPKLFQTLGTKRFTGILRFYHVRSHTRLGNILIKMNKITRDQLHQAVRLQLSHQGALRLGDALVQIGAIEPKDLDSALDLQAHARKGSDIELALALFTGGEFIGGYSFIHKQFKTTREDILPQLVGTEVLMDIIEGGLQVPLDLEPFWESSGPPSPQPSAPRKSSGPAQFEPAKSAASFAAPEAPVLPAASGSYRRQEETLSLKADDLILDMSFESAQLPSNDFLSMDEGEEQEQPAGFNDGGPEYPAAINSPEKKDIEPEASGPQPEPRTFPAELEPATFWIPKPEASASDLDSAPAFIQEEAPALELQGMEYLLSVAGEYLGSFGKPLLKKEAHPLPLTGREWPAGSLKELIQRFIRSSAFLIGAGQAEAMAEKIRKRIEV